MDKKEIERYLKEKFGIESIEEAKKLDKSKTRDIGIEILKKYFSKKVYPKGTEKEKYWGGYEILKDQENNLVFSSFRRGDRLIGIVFLLMAGFTYIYLEIIIKLNPHLPLYIKKLFTVLKICLAGGCAIGGVGFLTYFYRVEVDRGRYQLRIWRQIWGLEFMGKIPFGKIENVLIQYKQGRRGSDNWVVYITKIDKKKVKLASGGELEEMKKMASKISSIIEKPLVDHSQIKQSFFQRLFAS